MDRAYLDRLNGVISDEDFRRFYGMLLDRRRELRAGMERLERRPPSPADAQLQAQMQGFINTLSSKVAAKGGEAYFVFDVKAISGADVAKYIVAPQRYGTANIVATGTTEEFALHGENALASLEKDENVERIVVWNTQGKAETDPQAPNGYFVK
jgi:hypothetical protein